MLEDLYKDSIMIYNLFNFSRCQWNTLSNIHWHARYIHASACIPLCNHNQICEPYIQT